MIRFIITLLLACTLMAQAGNTAKKKVTALSPMLADLARQVGGDKIEVIDLLGKNGNPHRFNPSTKDLKKAQGSVLYLALGKNTEPYLPKLKSLIDKKAVVLEVGRNVLSLRIKAGSKLYACCPNHSNGVIDPHWWHSVEAWRRASLSLSKALIKADPANEKYYLARTKAYRKRLASLKKWAKKQISVIPKQQRHLATAHAAFGYFCQEFGFQSIPLKGLNSEQLVTPSYIKQVSKKIIEKKVRAIFPDESTNPKALASVAKATKVKLGGKLFADSHTSIEKMFRHNVKTIVKGLKK